MASATGIQAENPVRDEEQPLLGRPGDATQLPDQPIYFNLITGTGTNIERFSNISNRSSGAGAGRRPYPGIIGMGQCL